MVLLAGASGIGVAPILVRWSEVGPSATAFYRILLALPLLWGWTLGGRARNPRQAGPKTARDFLWLAAAGVFFTGDLAAWHWSLQFTSVANSTLLTNFAPIFVTLGAWVWLRERITPLFVGGMFVAIAGAGLLVGAKLAWGQLRGDLLALFTAVLYGGYLLIMKQLRHRYPTVVLMLWSGIFAAPGFLILAAGFGEALWPQSTGGWLVVAALALISHVGGQTLIAYGLGHLPASFSAVSLLWQPVVAAILAWALLKETLSVAQLLGALVVLGGIALAHRGQLREDAGERTAKNRLKRITSGADE